ncbi:hypothetical protein M7I_0826 [Glarea lozoyensis 74030]|uniref:Uncharacterized protein n=1 Tax=Glarea lozoyensis (strain ATCC 74030 / MF5533) TaxID=1104152 RepID=H0EEF1_GLAL7|nr:hypothetical protein M7I_0826 [Glarea lozoyensis 74030]
MKSRNYIYYSEHKFVAKPVTLWCQSVLENKKDGMVRSCVSSVYAALIIHTAILLGLVTGATYAGTSNLFAAYLAGAAISWWDGEFTKPTPAASNTPNIQTTSSTHTQENISSTTIPANTTPSTPSLPPPTTTTPSQTSGTATFTRFYEPALHRILKPLFFASIGFAIPITKLFSGPIMWRGIIYTILMLISKLATGFWLLKFSVPIFSKLALKFRRKTLKNSKLKKSQKPITSNTGVQLQHIPSQPSQPTTASSSSPTPANTSLPRQPPKANTTPTKVPLSLYPAAMLGTAMTARGEIGFLIASLAETTGVFSSQTTTPVESSEIYLITTDWNAG